MLVAVGLSDQPELVPKFHITDGFSHTNRRFGSTATECLSRIGASDQGLSGYNWGTIGNGQSRSLRRFRHRFWSLG